MPQDRDYEVAGLCARLIFEAEQFAEALQRRDGASGCQIADRIDQLMEIVIPLLVGCSPEERPHFDITIDGVVQVFELIAAEAQRLGESG